MPGKARAGQQVSARWAGLSHPAWLCCRLTVRPWATRHPQRPTRTWGGDLHAPPGPTLSSAAALARLAQSAGPAVPAGLSGPP